MTSKWFTALASLVALVLVGSGLSFAAQDEKKEGTLEKIMEDVNKANNVLRKAVRSEVVYKKGREEANKSAKSLVTLGKKAREFKEPAEKQKKEYKEWTELMDKFVKTAEALEKETGLPASKSKDAKKAFDNMGLACTNCHNVFRVDETDPFKN